MMMKKFFKKILTLATFMAMISCNESRRGNDSNLNEDRNEAAKESNADKFQGKKQNDAKFVYEVVAANYAEIKLAELANQRSRNAEVKNSAQKIQSDHSTALNEIKILAQAKAISVPVEETDKAKRKIEDFAGESGKEFDRKWCKEMMDKHEESIDKFERRLENTEDVELKAWVSKTLPVLRMHYDRLKACYEKLKENK
jgi:putative membrane protein